MKKLFYSFLLLTVSVALPTFPQDSDYYEIEEHGPGRWVTFTSPLQVQQSVSTPGILEYTLTFNPDFEIREGRDPLFVFKFEEMGKLNPALKPQLPANTHVQFIIDGTPTAELPLKKIAFRNERDERHVLKFYVVANRQIVERMIGARSIRGLLYFRQQQGTNMTKSNVKTFMLDQKAIRTLARLVEIAR